MPWFAQIVITNSTLAFDMQNLARLRSCLHEGNYLHTGSWRLVPHPSLTPNPPNHPPQSKSDMRIRCPMAHSQPIAVTWLLACGCSWRMEAVVLTATPVGGDTKWRTASR